MLNHLGSGLDSGTRKCLKSMMGCASPAGAPEGRPAEDRGRADGALRSGGPRGGASESRPGRECGRGHHVRRAKPHITTTPSNAPNKVLQSMFLFSVSMLCANVHLCVCTSAAALETRTLSILSPLAQDFKSLKPKRPHPPVQETLFETCAPLLGPGKTGPET